MPSESKPRAPKQKARSLSAERRQPAYESRRGYKPPDPDLLIGTSGFMYKHWRHGVFYPEGLPSNLELEYFADRFPTVELNNPFYRLPPKETFANWRIRSPEPFLFAVKASRFITHIKKLNECKEPVDVFLDHASGLREKLGPILFQFPRTWRLHLDRLETFLRLLPNKREFTFEFRHPEWLVEPVYACLRRFGAALCLPVGPNVPPTPAVITAGFTYIRMHSGEAEAGNFSERQLRRWAARIRRYRGDGIKVYIYFNNDWQGFAIQNAYRIAELLDVPLPE